MHSDNTFKGKLIETGSSKFAVRGIFNILCGGLNNIRCSFLIMRSGLVVCAVEVVSDAVA